MASVSRNHRRESLRAWGGVHDLALAIVVFAALLPLAPAQIGCGYSYCSDCVANAPTCCWNGASCVSGPTCLQVKRSESEYSTISPCAGLDCVWDSWTAWSTCTAPCGGTATVTRSRVVLSPELPGGQPCSGSSTDSTTCYGPPCPVNCVWGAWSSWSPCNAPCGGSGSITRTRSIAVPAANGGVDCTGSTTDSAPCSGPPCPIDCVWSQWSAWSCNAPCGTSGTQTRSRSVVTSAQYGGAPCTGLATDSSACTGPSCPVVVNCAWGAWGAWSPCSATTCGTSGTSTRSRSIAVNAQNGGLPCTGSTSESTPCNASACPIDCSWAPWSQWSSCSAGCGTNGTQSRSRTVAVLQANGGSPCAGSSSDSQTCIGVCAVINCTWGAWSSWSVCDAPCGQTGSINRTRSIITQAQNGGNNCTGSNLVTQNCNGSACNPSSSSNPISPTGTLNPLPPALTSNLQAPTTSNPSQTPTGLSSSSQSPIVSSNSPIPAGPLPCAGNPGSDFQCVSGVWEATSPVLNVNIPNYTLSGSSAITAVDVVVLPGQSLIIQGSNIVLNGTLNISDGSAIQILQSSSLSSVEVASLVLTPTSSMSMEPYINGSSSEALLTVTSCATLNGALNVHVNITKANKPPSNSMEIPLMKLSCQTGFFSSINVDQTADSCATPSNGKITMRDSVIYLSLDLDYKAGSSCGSNGNLANTAVTVETHSLLLGLTLALASLTFF